MARRLLPLLLLFALAASPAAASAASFTGTSWKVTRIGRHAVSDPDLVLTFPTRRAFAGYDGCNHFSGHYRARGSALRFRDLVSTAIGCEGGTLPSLTGALLRTRRYVLGARRLSLRRNGRTLVVLRRM